MELKVLMLNINRGNNKELLAQCKLLREYMLYVECVRTYAKEMKLDAAVEQAVDECIQKGILREFLSRYRSEAIAVSIFEYDEEREKEKLRKAEYKAGEEHGLEQGLRNERERFKQLSEKLQKRNRIEDLLRATTDFTYRDTLYQEYDIQKNCNIAK